MIIKGIKDEDFLQYKLPSMLVAFPSCTFKCEQECPGCKGMCQNSALVSALNIEISAKDIVDRYLSNPITKALVCGGLEPFDSFEDLLKLAYNFRLACNDPMIIYTGYTKEELENKFTTITWTMEPIEISYIDIFKNSNTIIKFGRYIPNQEPHYDEVLGIYLASDNQYAEKIS